MPSILVLSAEGSVETIVWLNVDECPQAAQFLHIWANRFVEFNGGNEKQAWDAWCFGRREKSAWNLVQVIPRFTGPWSMSDPRNWEAVKPLITKPWWRRLWVFQEVVLPKSVARHIKNCFQVDEVVYEVFKFRYRWHNSRREGNDAARFYDPLNIVSQLAHRLVTNPRDKIFAVAGLMKRNDIVHINYEDKLDKAYASFAKDQATYWPSSGSTWSPDNSQLKVLSFAGIGHIRSKSPLGAPTWVPDWRLYERKDNGLGARQMPTPLDARSYSAGGSRKPKKEDYWVLQVIIISGVLFDKVSKKGSEVHASPGRQIPQWPPGSLDQRTLFETSRGYLGLGPAGLQKEDEVCVFFGCNVPHLLRVRTGTKEHLLVGEAYVHGSMHGEVNKMLDEKKIKPAEIWLH